ncbi:hypothetical protein JO84_gp352 [Aureococcus anophagefferens virus]|uniref:Uncharacterized protein n=1 Tax=Aureococcus anophagefferens virus TaxID=1474867 RepID=A0A076FME1_9VIRU|nr:hypothetical protein JO84_gp352 [Aureococcus anophagefferens virus]AII17073.1 hypothetical protein AaV_121 [Aureococcus anophagefferens virus]UOG94419.1 hypothetical protein MKD35_385 [Aureococcus anophagefferens virus]
MICDLKNQKNLKKCLTKSTQFNKEFILMQNSKPYLIQLDNITIKKVDNEKNWFTFDYNETNFNNLMKKLKIKDRTYFAFLNNKCETYNLNKNITKIKIEKTDILDVIALIKIKEQLVIDTIKTSIKFEIFQLKKHVVELEEIQEIQETKNNLPKKYERMIKMGIPLEAVHQKMTMDKMNKQPKVALLNSICLKKTVINKKKPSKSSKHFEVSEEQIKNILKNLKPIA